MCNCCSHGTLPRNSNLQARHWSICYFYQDLRPRRLHAGSRPDRFMAHRDVLPTRRGYTPPSAVSLNSPDGPAQPTRSAPSIFRAS